MSVATTSVFLFIGLDNERRKSLAKEWPASEDGFIGVVDGIENYAELLEAEWELHYCMLNLSCVWDYDITEEMGAWLYLNPDSDHSGFCAALADLVAKQAEKDLVYQ